MFPLKAHSNITPCWRTFALLKCNWERCWISTGSKKPLTSLLIRINYKNRSQSYFWSCFARDRCAKASMQPDVACLWKLSFAAKGLNHRWSNLDQVSDYDGCVIESVCVPFLCEFQQHIPYWRGWVTTNTLAEAKHVQQILCDLVFILHLYIDAV